jgi:hypothetical protein
VKNTATEQIDKWMAEMREKAPDRLGLLVIKRKGHGSPGEWWCWLWLNDLLELCNGLGPPFDRVCSPVRMELQHVMPLLVHANYAAQPRQVA